MVEVRPLNSREIQVWFVPDHLDCDLWEVASVRKPALISLRRVSKQVKVSTIAHNVRQEVCYWRPGVRAWSHSIDQG